MLRVSYARTLETPFNENLVLSKQRLRKRCARNPLLALFAGCFGETWSPAYRNEFHAGFQQAFGKIPGVQRRIHLEVHPQRLRLQRAWQHADYVPHRLAQLEDSGLCAAAWTCRIITDFTRLRRHVFAWPRASSRRRSAGAGRYRWVRADYPFRIDHDEKFNQIERICSITLSRGKVLSGLWFGIQLAL